MPTVKTAISLDRELLEEIDAIARASGKPRSRVLADAAREYLHHRESQQLLNELNQVYSDEDAAEQGRTAERTLRRRRHRELVEGEW